MSKPFLTYSQQIEKLRDKCLTIENENDIEKSLHLYRYFSLVSGYKDLLKNPSTKKYKDGTTFQDLIAIYTFDERLREITLHYLLHIEQHIRSALSYSFCFLHGESQTAYLLPTNYDYTSTKKCKEIDYLVKSLKRLLDHPERYPYILHHHNHYNNVPLWVLMNAISFGTLSKMYQYSKSPVQSAVSIEFTGINESQLRMILEVLTSFRNVCAHGDRLFTYKCAKQDIPDLLLHEKLKIPKRGNEYIYGKRDYFAVMLAFCYLLPRNEFLEYKREVSKLIDCLLQKTQQISQEALFDMMGLPPNWKKITSYKKV